MSLILRLSIFLAGGVMIWAVLVDLRKSKLSEKQSLFWVVTSVFLFLVAAMPLSVLQGIGDFFSVSYVPSLIFMLVLILLVFGVYFLFRSICKHEMKVSELAQQISLLRKEVADLKAVADGRKGDERAN